MEPETKQAKGGFTRAARLSPEDRREIASKAAEARWGSTLPQATHSGELVIGGRKIICAVLQNGKRVLTQETFLTAIGRAAKAKAGTGSLKLVDGLPPFLVADNLKPFISDEMKESTTPIVFRTTRGVRAFGYDAMLLPMVCEVYVNARDDGKLLKGQEHIAAACYVLMKGLARVGIIALVDEATGYQEQRAKDELARILEAYVQEEYRRWTRMFPEEFFRQIYRIHDWPYKPGNAKRTPLVGHLINKYVYGQLPPGVLDELRRLNPVTERGYRKRKHFQHLTADTGNEHLDRQIMTITTLMRISDTKEELERNIAKAFGKPLQAVQERIPLVIDVNAEPIH
jgi:P63C domain